MDIEQFYAPPYTLAPWSTVDSEASSKSIHHGSPIIWFHSSCFFLHSPSLPLLCWLGLSSRTWMAATGPRIADNPSMHEPLFSHICSKVGFTFLCHSNMDWFKPSWLGVEELADVPKDVRSFLRHLVEEPGHPTDKLPWFACWSLFPKYYMVNLRVMKSIIPVFPEIPMPCSTISWLFLMSTFCLTSCCRFGPTIRPAIHATAKSSNYWRDNPIPPLLAPVARAANQLFQQNCTMHWAKTLDLC